MVLHANCLLFLSPFSTQLECVRFEQNFPVQNSIKICLAVLKMLHVCRQMDTHDPDNRCILQLLIANISEHKCCDLACIIFSHRYGAANELCEWISSQS
jgi:hypothetical protein